MEFENLESGIESIPSPAPLSDESRAFVGKWNRLVSATNWEKGKIIQAWREKLAENGVGERDFSDEAWSRIVGDVTPQHVGRLRRTFARFGRVQREYTGLYWSHFYAALDWNDAEMWLEGAVQGKWSVAEMRRTRWQATQGTRGEPLIESEVDQAEIADGLGLLQWQSDVRPNSRETVDGPIYDAVPQKSHPQPGPADGAAVEDDPNTQAVDARPSPVRSDDPYAAWEDLPDDLARVVEEFKIVALRYKMEGWQELSQERMRQVLEGLLYLIQAE